MDKMWWEKRSLEKEKTLLSATSEIWNRATVFPKPAHKLDITWLLHFESKLSLYGNAVTVQTRFPVSSLNIFF